MRLVAYPRIGPPDAVRVWLGAFGCDAPFVPEWRVDGQPADARVLRPVTPIRAGQRPRAFYGVFELPLAEPRRVRVTASAPGGPSVHLDTKPAPGGLVDGGRPLRVLLLSCFYCHQAEANGLGTALQTIQRLAGEDGIDLTLLLGDQVYLDLPTFEQYERNEDWLAERFEQKYVDNWDATSELAPILRAAPFVGIPDDHEYWNNAPEAQPWMDNTWTEDGRKAWRDAARQMFVAFQAQQFQRDGTRHETGAPFDLDLGAVRIFLLDTRTHRESGATTCSRPDDIAALATWAGNGGAAKLDVFVTGQSLFRPRAGSVSGRFADYELPNYQDFPDLLRALDLSTRPLLYVTGDVHWGRVARYLAAWQRHQLAEVIVTPSALVATPVSDQLNTAWGWIKGVFSSDPWPRHSRAEEPPDVFPTVSESGGPEKHVRSGDWQGVAGDQVAVLELALRAGKLEVQPYYVFATQRDLPAPAIPPLVFQDE